MHCVDDRPPAERTVVGHGPSRLRPNVRKRSPQYAVIDDRDDALQKFRIDVIAPRNAIDRRKKQPDMIADSCTFQRL
jgi:hypothetical protein